MFANDLHSLGIQKSILDFQNFNSASSNGNAVCSSSQNDPVPVDFPKFLNLTCEEESKSAKNEGQSKKKKRKKRVYSPRKKRKQVALGYEALDTDEVVNSDLAALAVQAIDKGRDSDSSSNTVLSDIPLLAVGQELEKKVKQNTQAKSLLNTEAKEVLNKEKRPVETTSNMWHISSSSNFNITVQKDHVLLNKIGSHSDREQNLCPLLPVKQENSPMFQNDAKNMQLFQGAPPVLTQEKKNLEGSVLKKLLMPELKKVCKPDNPKSIPAFLPFSSAVNVSDKSSNIRAVQGKNISQNVSKDASIAIADSEAHQYGMKFHPIGSQQSSTEYANNNFIHITNIPQMKNDKSKISSHSRPTFISPTQMNFHQTRFTSLLGGNLNCHNPNICNTSNKSNLANEHNDYVFHMDFEVEAEKDNSVNLIPPTLIKEEKISDDENVSNFVPKTNSQVNEMRKGHFNGPFSVASKTLSSHEDGKSKDVSSIDEIEENLPLSHYLKKFQSSGNIVTEVKRINSQNAISQKTASTSLLGHIPPTIATKEPTAKRKAKSSAVKSPKRKGARNKLDIFPGSALENDDKNYSETSNLVVTDNSSFCHENKTVPKNSKITRKNSDDTTTIMKADNSDMLVEMSFEEDDCDKQSNLEDLLALPTMQGSADSLSKNSAQSKVDPFPLLPFIKTEPGVIPECVSENERLPEQGNDAKSTSNILDDSPKVQNEDFNVANNTAASTKSSNKRVYQRKRVRKGGGKKKRKAAKLDNQPRNDDTATLDEKCADASVSFASELSDNNVPIAPENGNETLPKAAITNESTEEHNNDSISTRTEDEINNLIDEDSVSNYSASTLFEDGKDKPNKNQKKKRSRKKTSWYPKKRKKTPKKKAVNEEETNKLDLTKFSVETSQSAENAETLSLMKNNVQNNEPNFSNLKLPVNVPSETLGKSQEAVSALKPKEPVNETSNSAKLSTKKNKSKVSEKNLPQNSVSIEEFQQTLLSIKKEKADCPKTAVCTKNVQTSAVSKPNSRDDAAKEPTKSSSNDTANVNHSLKNSLQSIKTEKPDEPVTNCRNNILCETTKTATATLISNDNAGLAVNLNACKNACDLKISQKQCDEVGLNRLIQKDNENSNKMDNFSSKRNIFSPENVGEIPGVLKRRNIPCTKNVTQNTCIPVSQDSAQLKNLSVDINVLEQSDFIKTLQSIKKEKVDEGSTSKIDINSKEISNEARSESIVNRSELNLEKTNKSSSLNSSNQCDKILWSIKKEISEAGIQNVSNSENPSADFPSVVNISNSPMHTSNNNEASQNKELNTICSETFSGREISSSGQAFSEKNNLLINSEPGICQSNSQFQFHINASSVKIKKEINEAKNCATSTQNVFNNLQHENNSLSRDETYNNCSLLTTEKLCPLSCENETVKYNMRQASSGTSILNVSHGTPQFLDHLLPINQNFALNLFQNNDQVSFINNNNSYSAVNKVAGFPKSNSPLILNNCSPSPQYNSFFDNSGYASDSSAISYDPVCNVPFHPVSTKCSTEFFKYPYPAEINLTKIKPKFRSKSKMYGRVETSQISLSLNEVSEKLQYFENYGVKSGNKLGDIVRVMYYPLCKNEIECYHRIIKLAPSQKLLSMCVKSDHKPQSPLAPIIAPNTYEFQNSVCANDCQVSNKASSSYSGVNELDMSLQEKNERHKMVSNLQLGERAFTKESDIPNQFIYPLNNNYLPTMPNVSNETFHSVQNSSSSQNSEFLKTNDPVDNKAWQDIYKAVQMLKSNQIATSENKYLSKSVDDCNEKSEKFHSNVNEKIIPNVNIRSQPVSGNTYVEYVGEIGTRPEECYTKPKLNEKSDTKLTGDIHKIQFLFKEVADSFGKNSSNAENSSLCQQSNTTHAVSEGEIFQPEVPTESYEWRRMDSSLPAGEQSKNAQEATVFELNKDNEAITGNKSCVYLEDSAFGDSSIHSALHDVKLPVTELRKILEAANLKDGSQKQTEIETNQYGQDKTEGKHVFSTLGETSYYSDIIASKLEENVDKGENSELNSISISNDSKNSTDVFEGPETNKMYPISEMENNKSSANVSNSNSQNLSDSDEETIDNDVLHGNESCNSSVEESDTETPVSLKESTKKQKKDKDIEERDSPPLPQYKSKWEKIMERKALETNNKDKIKMNEHFLKDCFPVSAKISKNKKTVETVSDLSATEKKKKHKKTKHESKKHKSSKISKKSHSSKSKKSVECSISKPNNKSNVSNVKTPYDANVLKSTSKLADSSKNEKLKKSSNASKIIGKKKQDEQAKLHVTKRNCNEMKQKCKNISLDDGSDLFKPDKVVLKTDDTNSSRRFYGNRITNRGTFLTQSSDKPSKPKPIVIKKMVNKSKDVPAIRTEEYHSVIQSPDINIHSFSPVHNAKHSAVSDYRNPSPISLNRQNMALNSNNFFTPYNKPSYNNRQINDFEDFLSQSPQVSVDSLHSILRKARGNDEELQSQINLRTENLLEEESFSSSSSQNLHQMPVMPSKGFEMLSSLLSFNKKPLNQPQSASESLSFAPPSPALSHTRPSCLENASPFEIDSGNLRSPLFSEGLNLHQSNSQSGRLNSGKCICLPPRQLKLNVGHTIIDSLNVLLLILEWNVDWLFQQQKNHDPPPISKSLHKVSDKYETYEEYYNTFLPLMLLETWQRIYVSWTHLHQAHPYFCEILSYSEESSYITVECQTAYNAHDHDKSVFPEEGNIIMVKFATKTKGGIKILGYVTNIKLRPFNPATDTKLYSNKNLKNIRDDQVHMLKLTFMGAYASDEFDRKQPIRVQVLCNIKSTLKQNDALLFANKSPLHRNILNPLDSGLSSVTLPPRSVLKEPDRVNECVKEIIKGIVSPHPIPLLTVIKSLPSSDRLLVLPPLITRMKESYRTKVLLCTRTTKALAEVGLCLEDHRINIVIIGKRADTHVKLRRYLLDDLAVTEINRTSDMEDVFQKGNLQKEHIKPEVLLRAKQNILTACDVMLCLIRNSHDDLMAQTFHENECIAHMCCIVDEANLCTEPETLIPLMYGISKLILIGDPDVPAKVCSKSAINLDYKRSLFHRAYDLDLISD